MDSTTNTVRETLRRIIEKHGQAIYESPKRLESLLRDLCGAHRREINIITGALEERVAADLITKHRVVPRDMLLAQLAQRLQDHLAYTPDAALWAIETWAFALGVLSEQDLEACAQKRCIVESTPTVERINQSASQSPSPTQQPKPSPRQPSPPSPVSPASPPRASPPIRQPSFSPKVKPASPATTRTNSAQAAPLVFMPQTTQTAVQPKPTRRGFGWRGCLVMVLVCIVLFIAGLFIVPPVIMQLREEQSRPSINEPRINR